LEGEVLPVPGNGATEGILILERYLGCARHEQVDLMDVHPEA